jgi:hypothetical protein
MPRHFYVAAFFMHKKTPYLGSFSIKIEIIYMRSIAMAKKVTLKGKIMEQYPPPIS